MSDTDRIFADDWRDCLSEQYKYVIQQQDSRTEATLVQVLHDVGFTDDDLHALRLAATMRAEDMPDDFVPEEIKQSYAGVETAPAEEPQADAPDPVIDEPEASLLEDNVELEPDPVTFDELVAEEPAESEIEETESDDADDNQDAPQQLTMF